MTTNKKADNSCKHEHWIVHLDCRVGTGYCYDCKQDINLVTLFNNLKERMEAIVQRYDAKLKELK